MNHSQLLTDTIVALSTPPGSGAIAVIRLSGPECIEWTAENLSKPGLYEAKSHTAHYGLFRNAEGEVLDELVVTIFKNPNSYTRQNVVEVSAHASDWIIEQIIQRYLEQGARYAEPGEFTFRAYMNGQLDLSQAEAVADLISAESREAHRLALHQLRGGFSNEIDQLRQQLIDFASLIELELDFGEEDVTFADRNELQQKVAAIQALIQQLIDSFQWGNAVKKGIQTVIAGRPNAGKSTLLNALLKEERAIVSDIAGTTRDTIEESLVIEGIPFRFIDTAGLREATDAIEEIGVRRTYDKIQSSAVVLYVFDTSQCSAQQLKEYLSEFRGQNYHIIALANKVDQIDDFAPAPYESVLDGIPLLGLSALQGEGLKPLLQALVEFADASKQQAGSAIVTNSRHHAALTRAHGDLGRVLHGLQNGITGDFIAMDIRQALHHLGEITGHISVDDLLGNIFSNFCIGK
jgi:tRNA modification GTPase